MAEQQVSHDDPFYVNNAVEGLTGIDTTLWDSPFPYSHTLSRGLDLDHTVAYRPSCRDPQTGIGLLTPLSRKVHRAKTAAAWHAQHKVVGEIVWTSPLGYQYLVTPERTYAVSGTALSDGARHIVARE